MDLGVALVMSERMKTLWELEYGVEPWPSMSNIKSTFSAII